MSLQIDTLCLQYFGNKESTFQINIRAIIYNLSNPSNQKKPTDRVLNNNFLTNYQTLAQLIIKNLKTTNNSSSDEYFKLFNENIDQFINVGELLLKKYFNCNNYKEWEQNIVKLLNHHHRKNSHTKNQQPSTINSATSATTDSIIISKLSSLKTITNIENVIKQLKVNYGILNDYIKSNISEWKKKNSDKCKKKELNKSDVFEYFLTYNKMKKFIELSTTTIDDDEKKLMKRIEEFKNSIIKLELQLSESEQQQSNLQDVNNQLNDKIIELQLQLSQANTILSFNSFNLLQQKYIEQSKNILLKYFNNELMNILLNLPSTIDEDAFELLEILMKRSICYAFNTKYSINTLSSSSDSIILCATQHLVLLLTQFELISCGGGGGANSSGVLTAKGIELLLELFHKLVKELFDCIHSIPKEALIQFDFTNNLKDKTLLIESTDSSSSSDNETTTTNGQYYCIQPTLYSGGVGVSVGCNMVVEQQGILVNMFN